MASQTETQRMEFVITNQGSSDTKPATTSQGQKTVNTTSGVKSGNRPRGKTGENIAKYNFKSVAKVGLIIRQSDMANELVGAYTGDRLRQRKFKMAKQGFQYAYGIAQFGVFGLAYAVGDISYRGAMYQIEVGKKNREAGNLRNLSGNNAFSNRRYGGKML